MNQSAETFLGLDQGIAPVDGATGATNGAEIDMLHWAECAFILNVGVISGTVDMKIQGTNTSGSGHTDITGWAITQLAATADGSVVGLRVRASATSYRYLRAVVTITGGAASFISVTNVPYGAVNTDATFGTWEVAGNPSAS